MKDITPLIEQAKSLQAQGLSYPEVAKAMGRSKSAVELYLNPERLAKHREKARARSKRLYAENPEKMRAAHRAYARAHPERKNAYARAYYQRNIHAKRAYLRNYYWMQMAKNSNAAMACKLRVGLHSWWHCMSPTRMAKDSMQRKLDRWLGCTPLEFRAHLERQFTGAMSWQTYGTEWELDHIRPLMSFDLLTDEGCAEAMHYTNCRPLHPSLNRGRERREKLYMQGHIPSPDK